MSILNVDQISPIGSGSTITVTATETKTGDITIGTGTSIFSPAGNTLVLGTNNVERIRIKNDGKIGIGIAAPTSTLYVNGTSSNDVITARAADTNGISVINILAEGTTGHSRIKFSDTAGTDGQISYTHTDRALTFAAGGTTERLRIGSSGQIGLSGANYGTAGQVLTSQGSGSAVQWATPSSGAMTLLATMTTNMSANTLSQALNLTGYHKLMGTVTGLQRSGGLNDTWFGFNNLTASGSFSWVRHYLDNSNDTSTNRQGTSTGYAYGSVGPGFFLNGAGFAGADSGNNDAEFTVHNLQDGGRKIFEMHARSYLTRNIVINTTGSINTTNAISSFEVHVDQASHRLTGGTIKLYGFK